GLFKKTIAFQILQIANVLTEESLRAAYNANRVFQFSTNRQEGLRFALQRHGHGDKSAGAAQLLRLAGGVAHNGIVATPQDVAVVHEERVGHAAQALYGLIIVDGDGFLAEVATGHHKSIASATG